MDPKDWRKEQDLTLAELSARTGFAQSYLSEVENKVKTPSFALAKAYHKESKGKVSLNDF